ncbi:MAG: bifunctional diguanylate cyclase/phosphodiesterase [Kaiparowitsia implicata GSE-PSE-MK54-09C]|jgi:diguanylate cyclase (GGDEF)-like protein|nr:bifunctional diguanylate cyclase/phosphodiesterase [Kaiparowitsia implicata GSE-PSE-MK54-09C]
MLPLVWFRQLVLVIVAVLGISAVLHARVVQDSADAVNRSMRFDVSWIGAHGRIEAAQLEVYLARYAALRLPADAESAELYYQILLGRLDSWNVGGYREFLDSSPANRETFDRLRLLVESFETEFSDLSQVASLSDLLEAWRPVGPAIDQLGAEATTSAVSKAAEIRETLTGRQEVQNYLVVTLLGAGLLLLVLLLLQNRSLWRAHADTRRVADDFAYVASHDPLTGLPNRNALTAYNKTDRPIGHLLAVVALDLDGFKQVNDTWSHLFGDKLLVQVAQRLRALIRDQPGGLVARLGGDEFVIMTQSQNLLDAQAFAENVLVEVSQPYEIDGGKITIGATAGLALADDQRWDAMTLMADADLAQNDAKLSSKGSVRLYNATLRQGVERRLRLENALRDAIGRGEIVPNYQVQVDLRTNGIVGVEALARWQHPELGAVSPAEFIPIAEASGQIAHIGRYMIEQACRDAMLLPDDIHVAVNLSVIQIMQGEVIETVENALRNSGLPAQRLKLEVTESVLMVNPKRVIEVLEGLRARGIAIALDDFGTGFSSLSYLSTFRWDELKIDRSFVKNLGEDTLGLAIIEAILVMAKELGAKVIVEGIETCKQVQLLERTDCDIGQGFLFGRPEPIDTVRATISKGRVPAVPAIRIVEPTT